MTDSTDDLEDTALPLPIVQAARETAQQFANQQPTPAKARQVQRNTLAVWVVHDYLQWLGIATDLTAGDSWNAWARLGADVADLEVAGLGRLECRPVERGMATCAVPPEVWQDRIGYVIVQLDEALQEAQLLGFTTTPAIAVPLNQLRSPEDLLDHLDALRQTAIAPVNRPIANLSQWLQGVVDAGWETIDALLMPSQPAFAFRNLESLSPSATDGGIQRAKLLHFGRSRGESLADAQWEHPIALLIAVHPNPAATATELTTVQIRLELHPLNQPYLPSGLQVRIGDASGAVFLEAAARPDDNAIRLEFGGQREEPFSVQMALQDEQITESFVI